MSDNNCCYISKKWCLFIQLFLIISGIASISIIYRIKDVKYNDMQNINITIYNVKCEDIDVIFDAAFCRSKANYSCNGDDYIISKYLSVHRLYNYKTIIAKYQDNCTNIINENYMFDNKLVILTIVVSALFLGFIITFISCICCQYKNNYNNDMMTYSYNNNYEDKINKRMSRTNYINNISRKYNLFGYNNDNDIDL